MRRYFGTDGVRGTYGKEPMTTGFVYRLARAAGRFFLQQPDAPHPCRVMIGRDTRESGAGLEEALCAGLKKEGLEPIRLGVLPSGAVSMLSSRQKACAGAMISASHNPWQDNGIKFFQNAGTKLSDEQEEQIEVLLDEIPEEIPEFPEAHLTFHPEPEAMDAYGECILQTLPPDFSLSGFLLVVDAAHGAAWMTTPTILKRLGAEVESLADAPNGKNINEDCGSEHPGPAAERVTQLADHEGHVIGICHDGDADRLVMIDEEGAVLDGDELLAVLAIGLKQAGQLESNTVVATLMSNLGLDECLKKEGIQLERTAVGDRYVLEAMLHGGHSLGGEQSGHILLLDHAQTGDGLLAALHLLRIIRESGRPLSELRKVMPKYPQKLTNLNVSRKPPLEEINGLGDLLRKAERDLGDEGRINLRYSGTENKIRLLVEARTEEKISEIGGPILALLEQELG
jgi:phosphoglucosamine mutase